MQTTDLLLHAPLRENVDARAELARLRDVLVNREPSRLDVLDHYVQQVVVVPQSAHGHQAGLHQALQNFQSKTRAEDLHSLVLQLVVDDTGPRIELRHDGICKTDIGEH